MNLFRFHAMLCAAFTLSLCAYAQDSIPAPTHLRTEYLANPLGIATDAPRFGWWMRHDDPSEAQAAYRVLVASTPDILAQDKGDLWDSGKVASDESVEVPYTGQNLNSFQRAWWKVCLWDKRDRPSAFSEPATFELAALKSDDFSAKWIQGTPDDPGNNGCRSRTEKTVDDPSWLQVDLGESKRVCGLVLYPACPYYRPDLVGFGFPVRFHVEISDTPDFKESSTILSCDDKDQPNPGAEPAKLQFHPKDGRYLRLVATKLAPNGEGRFVLALAELQAFDEGGHNLSEGKEASAEKDVDEEGWSPKFLTDGVYETKPAKMAAPLFRKAFKVSKPVARARAYASGLHYYELYLNGQRVGDRVLDPGNALFKKCSLYSTYDVTPLLREGDNAVGMTVGHGWYRKTPAAWLQLRIEYEDGRIENVATDDSWRAATGPVVFDSLYHGETYDARLEVPDWATPGFDDASWKPVSYLEEAPASMRAQSMPPIRVTGERKPVAITKRPEGSYIVDFGQNLTGWVRCRVQAPAGTAIKMHTAELLNADGSLNPLNLRSARSTDTYIAKGKDVETYEPRFTQHGFRYVEVSGWPGELKPENLEARIVHTDLERLGSFDGSNDLFNAIYRMSLWSMTANAMSIPTDCPQRDERMGWMGDAHLAAEAILLNFDAVSFYENWLRIIADSQSAEGYVPDFSPAWRGDNEGSPSWAVAYPLVTWYLYCYCGDKRVVAEHYDNLVRWFKTLEDKAESKGHILEFNRYADWCGVEETPGELVSTCYYYWTAQILGEFASLLGKEGDAKRFEERRAQIAEAFNGRFLDRAQGFYGNGSQCSQVFPLYLGIVPEDAKAPVLAHLRKEIVEKRAGHLATGIIGTKYLYKAVSDPANADLAYLVTLKEDYPSFGFMRAKGATTLWELWEEKTGHDMNSHNHVMFGSVVDWFFGSVAGIHNLPEPGYRHFTIAPVITNDLNFAEAEVQTVRGPVSCAWRRLNDGLELLVSIPPNATATVSAPAAPEAKAMLTYVEPADANGFEADRSPLPEGKQTDRGRTFELGSGKYRLQVH
jgi:alpha-L-rhamnosidase